MIRSVALRRLRLLQSSLLVLQLLQTLDGLAADELRGLWADAFHAGFKTSAEVSQMIADARAGNFNALIVEVRKRGDAYYNSSYEPKAGDVSPSSFDPLAELIAQAHNTNNGPRLEVHAWIVTYNIWNNQTNLPPQANHPYRLHPDWVTKSTTGESWDGSNYAFDPGHPEVQRHSFNVAMEIISRYDVDGFHFDYIRYGGNEWGYHDVTVERFHRFFDRGRPPPLDPQWLQFRRDQVTSLVRKVYLSAIELKPQIEISAATITWAPGITTDAQWPSSAAYASVLQDWRAWMQEGILDLNVPMAYFRQHTTYSNDWAAWSIFAKDHRYDRHVAIGPGIYLNTVSNSILQMRSTRTATARGNRADGVVGYSYAVTSSDGLPRSTFLSALTQPSAYDPNAIPLFPTPTNTPAMAWKTAPTRGHLKGFVIGATHGTGIDGGTVVLSGPVNRTLTTDATGFFGAVDLPPGDYTLTVSYPGLETDSTLASITAGAVTTRNFELDLPAGAAFFQNVSVAPGERSAILSWTTEEPAASQVEFGTSTNYTQATFRDDTLRANHETLLTGLAANTGYCFRLVAWSGTNEFRSLGYSFDTAGALIVDNPSASVFGNWTIGTSSTDKYSTNYYYAGTVSGSATATATFAPTITTPGRYGVYVWYPQGGNRSAATPFLVNFSGGTTAVPVNQTTGGGGWRLLAVGRDFERGTNGFVRLANNTGESGRVVIADAVRFVYVAGQDTPSPGNVPDWWAQYYFGAPVDGAADHDTDGYATCAEYVFGTAPNDPTSRFALRLEPGPNSVMQAVFSPFHAGRVYQLQALSELGATNWMNLSHAAPQPNRRGEGVIVDADAAGPQKYYRMQVTLAP